MFNRPKYVIHLRSLGCNAVSATVTLCASVCWLCMFSLPVFYFYFLFFCANHAPEINRLMNKCTHEL